MIAVTLHHRFLRHHEHIRHGIFNYHLHVHSVEQTVGRVSYPCLDAYEALGVYRRIYLRHASGQQEVIIYEWRHLHLSANTDGRQFRLQNLKLHIEE